MFNTIEEALLDYKNGKIIIVVDDENRENEGDMICNALYSTPENLNYMAQNARGLICVAIDNEVAKRMQLNQMVEQNRIKSLITDANSAINDWFVRKIPRMGRDGSCGGSSINRMRVRCVAE